MPGPIAPRLRVAVVGAGYFAAFHHQAWAAAPRADLVAIVDADGAKAAAAAAAAHGVPQWRTELETALRDIEVDLVDIVVPPDAHLELIDLATAAGKAVICQKPFCGGLAGATQAADLASQRNATLVVHENFRFQPWWRQIAQELADGRVGDLYDIAFRLRPGDGQGPSAYLSRQPYFQAMPRFLVHETAVHLMDVFRYLMGEPDWVQADLRRLNPNIVGEDAGVIVLGYDDGRRAVFDGNRLASHPAENRRYVMGEAWIDGAAGSLTLDGDGGLAFRAHDANVAAAIPYHSQPELFGGGCVGALQAHVTAHLLDGAPLENDAAAYRANLILVDAIYASATDGARIRL